MHISTHRLDLVRQLQELYEGQGWITNLIIESRISQECDRKISKLLLPSCAINTMYGPMYPRDGMLSMYNTKFVTSPINDAVRSRSNLGHLSETPVKPKVPISKRYLHRTSTIISFLFRHLEMDSPTKIITSLMAAGKRNGEKVLLLDVGA